MLCTHQERVRIPYGPLFDKWVYSLSDPLVTGAFAQTSQQNRGDGKTLLEKGESVGSSPIISAILNAV